MARLFSLSILLAVFFSACSGLFYNPTPYMYYPPEVEGLTQRNLYFSSGDGVRLHAWFFRAPHPRGTIVQFHGNAENMTSHYESLVWLTGAGYNLFTFDYRGYGESLGDPSQAGVHLDGIAALERALSLHERSGGGRFVVVGQSLGGAIALRCLEDFKEKRKVSAIVIDSSFISYKDEAQGLMARHWFTWPLSWLGRVLVSDGYAPKDRLRELELPLLVVHDKKDPVVPFENGKELFESYAHRDKTFWELDQGLHLGVFSQGNEAYRQKFLRFLEELKSRDKDRT